MGGRCNVAKTCMESAKLRTKPANPHCGNLGQVSISTPLYTLTGKMTSPRLLKRCQHGFNPWCAHTPPNGFKRVTDEPKFFFRSRVSEDVVNCIGTSTISQ
eukprot:5642395-Amphidinium_carterae.1